MRQYFVNLLLKYKQGGVLGAYNYLMTLPDEIVDYLLEEIDRVENDPILNDWYTGELKRQFSKMRGGYHSQAKPGRHVVTFSGSSFIVYTEEYPRHIEDIYTIIQYN